MPKEFRPGKLTWSHKQAIRNILNMRANQPFNRCRGKSKAAVRRLEEKGDHTHGKKEHDPCDLCRCEQVAGWGTKGNFYGLGSETGHYGVGFCSGCQRSHRILPGLVLKNARREVELRQGYGSVSEDAEYALKMAKTEAELAEQSIKQRQEMELVTDTLAEFKRQLAETDPAKKPTELSKDGAVPMSDKTRIQLSLQIAQTLSRLNLADMKLDSTKFILIDHVLAAVPELQQAVEWAFTKQEEMLIAKHVHGEEIETDQPIRDYVWGLFVKKWVGIWRKVKGKAGAQA